MEGRQSAVHGFRTEAQGFVGFVDRDSQGFAGVEGSWVFWFCGRVPSCGFHGGAPIRGSRRYALFWFARGWGLIACFGLCFMYFFFRDF